MDKEEMKEKLKYTKTEVENFVFPSKYLPNCFDNKSILSKIDIIVDGYDNALGIIKDNFEVEDGKIKNLRCLKNNIYNTKKGSEPINYIIFKPNGGNRIMSVVNPLFLIPLHQYILENKNDILYEQEDENELFSPASHFYYQDGGFFFDMSYDDFIVSYYQGHYYQNDYLSNLSNRIKISNGKFYCLKIDISSFYNNIYTHSISWHLKNEDRRTLFENLDVLNRTLNSNETKGIVIGPYTSAFFSELILSKVDRALIPFFREKDIFYQRYCDDYIIFSDSKEILENEVLQLVEKELSNYKLDINYSKISIEEFPYVEDSESLLEIINHIRSTLEGDFEESRKVESIIFELSKTIKRKYSDTNYVLSIITKFNNYVFDDESNIKILLNFLINLIFRNNLVSKYAVDLIFKIIDLNNYDSTKLIDGWIRKRNNLSSNIKNITDIWLAYIVVKLNIKSDMVREYLLSILGNNQLSDILVFEYMHNNQLFEFHKKDIKKYLELIEADFDRRYNGDYKDCYFTKYWLLFYTNSIRWKIHDIKGFKDTLFKRCYIENLIVVEKRRLELNILYAMYQQNVELFNM